MSVKKIYVDAGHGGSDPGAVKYVKEADVNIKMVNYICDYLTNNYICDVYKDISADSLTTICNRANAWGADLFVSIHYNAGGGDGFEALVYNSNNNLLGEIFVKHALSVGQNSRGVKYRPELAVLRLTNMPAVLNEIAFVDNMKDIKDWDEDHEIKKMGEAMARAAAEYLILSKKSSGSLNNITSNRNDEFKVKIIADILNIRKGPSTSHQKIGTVKKGEVYTIVKTSADGKWGLLKAGPIKGSSYICISSDYVKRV